VDRASAATMTMGEWASVEGAELGKLPLVPELVPLEVVCVAVPVDDDVLAVVPVDDDVLEVVPVDDDDEVTSLVRAEELADCTCTPELDANAWYNGFDGSTKFESSEDES